MIATTHLSPHDLPFVVGVGVVFTRLIVVVSLGGGVERGEFFEPLVVIAMQARLVVVDEHARRDVHRIDEHQAFLHAATSPHELQSHIAPHKATNTISTSG